MTRTFTARVVRRFQVLAVALASVSAPTAALGGEIDRATLDRWSAPYRGWHYWPDPVVPAQPNIPGHEAFQNTDCPCVYQLPGQPDRWYLSFIGFNGQGYNSFVARSTDLVHWTEPSLAMGFGAPGEFDHGGCVIGAFLYESYDIKAPRLLRRRDGKFWTLYGCYPRQGGYELRPGYEGVATSDDGLVWCRAKSRPILSVHDADCGAWEKSCIYQPWLVEHEGRFFNFYNAAEGHKEQMGLALSQDLLAWKRYLGNPILRNRPGGYDAEFCSDGKVFRDGDTGPCSTSAWGAAGPTSWRPSPATCSTGPPIPSRSIWRGGTRADWTSNTPTRFRSCTTRKTTCSTCTIAPRASAVAASAFSRAVGSRHSPRPGKSVTRSSYLPAGESWGRFPAEEGSENVHAFTTEPSSRQRRTHWNSTVVGARLPSMRSWRSVSGVVKRTS